MRKIALLHIQTVDDYNDYTDYFATHLSDFVECSDEDIQLIEDYIKKYNSKRWSYRMALVVENNHLLPKTIEDAKKFAKDQEVERKEKQKLAEKKKKEQELNKLMRTQEREKKLLEKLKTKYKGEPE